MGDFGGDLKDKQKRSFLRATLPFLPRRALHGARIVRVKGKAWLVSFMLATTALGGSVLSAWAEPASAVLEVEDTGNFARMVITFPDRSLLPPYEASISTSVLRISFPEGIAADVDDVPEALMDYVSIARADPDGAALRFALRQPVNINSMEAGEKLFIDLLPASYEGRPPSLPQDVVDELARRAAEALERIRVLEEANALEDQEIKVKLRVGRHPTFTRLIFDWNVQVGSAFERNGNNIRVKFDQAADLDLSQFKASLPGTVLDVGSKTRDNDLIFNMIVDPSVDVRSFQEGKQLIVDVTPEDIGQLDPRVTEVRDELFGNDDVPQGASNVINTLGTKDAAPSAIVPAVSAVVDQAPVAAPGSLFPTPQPVQTAQTSVNDGLDFPQMPLPVAKPELERIGDPVDRLAPADIPQSKPSEEDLQAEVGKEPEPVEAVVVNAQPVRRVKPEPAPETDVAPVAEVIPETDLIAEVVNAGGQTSIPVTPASEQDARATAVPAAAAVVADAEEELPIARRASAETIIQEENDAAARVVGVETYRIGDTVRLVFPFEHEVGAAVFRRDEKVWAVFDSEEHLDGRGIPAVLSDLARKVELDEVDGAQVLRFDLKRTTLISIEYQDDAWAITLGPSISTKTEPVDVERNVQGDGSNVLRLPFGASGRLHVLTDKSVGDRIYVVSGPAPVRGILKSHRFPQVQILRSSQGLAVVPSADGIDVELSGEDLVISRPDGLKISNRGLSKGTTIGAHVKDPTQPGLIEFAQLDQQKPEDYMQGLRAHEDAIAKADPEQLSGPRLDMARFFLSSGFAQEAIGTLRIMEEDDPLIEKDATFNVMMGAAQMLASRPGEALEYLAAPELASSPDAAVWRTFAHSSLGDWQGAHANLGRGLAVMANYPVMLQVYFNLAAAKTHLALGNYGRALGALSQIEPSDVNEEQAIQYDLLRGRIADASGRSQEALDVYDLVVRSSDGPEAAEAKFLSVKLRYRDGLIDADEALSELEGLAASWRGDETELKTLRLMAQLHAQEGNYRRAFEAMSQAVQSDAGAEITSNIQQEMGSVFATLFLEGRAQALEPVKALALFYDFRELVPAGRQGDEMARMLASRLIDMDLLDQAASVLRHQIDKRLKGAARAQIAADLAVVYLLNRKPEEALRVLSQTRQGQLPAALQRQRNIVEARALSESGRPDLALELVRNMSGSDVDRLRADTLWSARSWRKAGEQLEQMNGSRWSDEVPLADHERVDVIRAAIAYTLAEDSLGLERLRQKYSQKMSESPQAETFEIVTRPIDDRGVEFLNVAKSVGGGDSLVSFLEEYRRQYLSATPIIPTEEAWLYPEDGDGGAA
jgi:tetratricopeptide (TPR) repeat protein